MTDEAAFVRTIADRPADPLPRGVFADWLEECGRYADGTFQRILVEPDRDDLRLRWADAVESEQPERAEFCRVQVELAMREKPVAVTGRFNQYDHGDDYDALRRREQELIGTHFHEWRALAPAAGRRFQCDTIFRRGFPAELTLAWETWVGHSAALLSSCPIRNAADGLVRLTTWPEEPWQQVRQDVVRAGLCDVTLDALNAQLALDYPGVAFSLPAAGGEFRVTAAMAWDAIYQPTLREDVRRGRESLLRDAAYRAIQADTPEARP